MISITSRLTLRVSLTKYKSYKKKVTIYRRGIESKKIKMLLFKDRERKRIEKFKEEEMVYTAQMLRFKDRKSFWMISEERRAWSKVKLLKETLSLRITKDSTLSNSKECLL